MLNAMRALAIAIPAQAAAKLGSAWQAFSNQSIAARKSPKFSRTKWALPLR